MSTSSDAVQRAFDTLLLKARGDGSRAPTVAAVAARVGISRSSMYRFHGDVVTRIRALTDPKRAAQDHAVRVKMSLIAQQLKAERELTKALVRACAELAAEKVALAEQLDEERMRFTLRLETLPRSSKV